MSPSLDIVMYRVFYFEHVGQDAEALELLKKASQAEETKGLVTAYVRALYQKNRVQEALDVLEGSRQPESGRLQELRPFLLAEIDHGTERAYERVRNCRLHQSQLRESLGNYIFGSSSRVPRSCFSAREQKPRSFFRMAPASARRPGS